MRDLTDPKWIYFKGCLFVVGGLLASGLLWMENPTAKIAFLLALAIWCFARAYYFAFYVIEHYVDGSYRYSGLLPFLMYLIGKRRE